ncbi:hypothetical protein FAGKG844_70051 [Frankia sp. AgKG'84/4]
MSGSSGPGSSGIGASGSRGGGGESGRCGRIPADAAACALCGLDGGNGLDIEPAVPGRRRRGNIATASHVGRRPARVRGRPESAGRAPGQPAAHRGHHAGGHHISAYTKRAGWSPTELGQTTVPARHFPGATVSRGRDLGVSATDWQRRDRTMDYRRFEVPNLYHRIYSTAIDHHQRATPNTRYNR